MSRLRIGILCLLFIFIIGYAHRSHADVIEATTLICDTSESVQYIVEHTTSKDALMKAMDVVDKDKKVCVIGPVALIPQEAGKHVFDGAQQEVVIWKVLVVGYRDENGEPHDVPPTIQYVPLLLHKTTSI